MNANQPELLRGAVRNHQLQRNIFINEISKFNSKANVETKINNIYSNQNNPTNKRFSLMPRNSYSNSFKSQQTLIYKPRMSTCQILFGDQNNQTRSSKNLPNKELKKIPAFIKERQVCKSQKITKINCIFGKSPSQTINKKVKTQQTNKLKHHDKKWFHELTQQVSFQFDSSQHGDMFQSKQKLSKGTKQSSKDGKSHQQFKVEKQNICLDQKNIFLTNLSQLQQNQLRDDFHQLFSSRRIQDQSSLYELNQQLKLELMLLME